MIDRLAQICATKREEIAARKERLSLDELDRLAREQAPSRGFIAALSRPGLALIAEIKRASPSKGLIRPDFDPPAHARAYQAGGARCLSVLTDAPYFDGHEADLIAARAACSLPVLRKDFMLDPWQIAESRAIGADAILLIVAALDDHQLHELEAAALERQLDVLVEVHSAKELARALRLQTRLIGVNNRDLRTFNVDLQRTIELARLAPVNRLFVAESGIGSHDDLITLSQQDVRCFLVGEALMRQDDIERATRNLLCGDA